ncbi:protein kinase [Microtetraspora sp. NBRC 16547]|uniref:serine/threonine protein kinase n=1 Tax=Microtetraspora sp. NBRC 16547 TaxID=3030993 RepID=UPI0024A0F981|nr:protein kinase [Microtetraspora sp. NBRC 16547]GLW96254.1 hypothetical protein Misp02_03410 [Microtetraspora sp. NBRC 16547]
MPEIAPLQPGDPKRIGRYRLKGRLGVGGQGVVYLATGRSGEPVAVKWIHPDLTGATLTPSRFLREVAAAKRVATFCTAQILDTGAELSRPYIVSEYIDGPSLQQAVVTSGPIRGNPLHRLAVGTATALAAIHKAGIVHRDLKPPNVLMGSDGPRLIDFGISRTLDATMSLTSAPIGTPAYMAPEQFLTRDIGPEADMFSWAGTMVFAATGDSPFGNDSLPVMINRILNASPEVGDIEGVLRDLVTSCLSKDPATRPTAQEVIDALLERPAFEPATLPGPGQEGEAPQPPGEVEDKAADVSPLRESPAPPSPTLLWPPPDLVPPSHLISPPDTGPPRAPEAGRSAESGTRARRPYVKTASAVSVAALTIGASVFMLVSGERPDANTGTTKAVASASPSPSTQGPSPIPTHTVPTTGLKETKLPGFAATLREHPDDPVTVASYWEVGAEYAYARKSRSGRFKKWPGYLRVDVSPNGKHALGVPAFYEGDFGSIDIVDLKTGAVHKMRTTRIPKHGTDPQWSRDGRRALLTITDFTGKPLSTGFIIVDAIKRTVKVVEVDDPTIKTSTFGWDGTEKGVVALFRTGKTKGIRFFDLKGKVLRDITDIADQWDDAQFRFAPSGKSFITMCVDEKQKRCVWDTETGKERLRFEPDCSQFLGWYDEEHILCWQLGGGHQSGIMIINFNGDVVRTFLRSTDEVAEKLMVSLRFRFS